MSHIREKVHLQITGEQEKQKNHYGSEVPKPIRFKIGDQVLYFRTQLDQSHSRKFEPKWKGSYYIYQVLPNGAYKLRTIEGNVLNAPVNADLLKEYHDRHTWQSNSSLED